MDESNTTSWLVVMFLVSSVVSHSLMIYGSIVSVTPISPHEHSDLVCYWYMYVISNFIDPLLEI